MLSGKLRVTLGDAEDGGNREVILEAAKAYVFVGQYEAALQHLKTFVSTPSEYPLALLRFDPTWNPIRSNPRFQALLAKYEN